MNSPERTMDRKAVSLPICRTLLSLITLLLLAGRCTAPKETAKEPVKPVVEVEPVKPTVALVLGGGAARGFAHVGVLRVLAQEKIPIDMIIGTSVGSLIGAIYASHCNTFELEWTAFKLEKDDIFDFSIFKSATGPVKGDKLEKFVSTEIDAGKIEHLKVPFYAVAADLNTGEPVVFSRGSIAKAVRASCSIPGVFTPLELDGRQLIDGGVLGNIAPEVARRHGANFVIVVSIGKAIQNLETTNVVNITMQAISIMSSRIDHFKVKQADVLIAPEVGDVGMMDFSRKKYCMKEGIKAAREAVPEIKRKLEAFGKPQEVAVDSAAIDMKSEE
ncbi:MAG: patatin-like phospholipase family protein [Chitinivibrionales bacterium]|nr:patatin-like phospholipase family protein [Chitinivibrionales bacterium]MBD3395506.1 patatin-like phospholipase family protein [Chitinivibrionales bacterium]